MGVACGACDGVWRWGHRPSSYLGSAVAKLFEHLFTGTLVDTSTL